MILKTDAVILKVQKYRESSAILTLYTQTSGKMSVLAKGARRKNSPLAVALGVMNHVGVIVYWKQGRDLQLLSHCELRRSPRGMHSELDRIGAGMAMVELVNIASHPEEKNEPLFGALRDSLAWLDTATNRPENSLYYFEVGFLQMLGFRPSLNRCARCGSDPLQSPSKPRRPVCSVVDEGVLCAECSALGVGGPEVSLGAVQVLRRFQEFAGPEAAEHIRMTDSMRTEVDMALRWYLRRHVTGMRPLKSEKVFASIME